MAITTRGTKPAAADAILFAPSSTNISKPTTELQDSGYATQTRPGSANYNWLFNYVSAGIAHEFVYGIAEYDSGETYVANSYTNRLGLIYRSRTAGNIGNVPESSPNQWHDIRTPLEFVISATETHAPQSLFHELLTCDASVAGFTLTVDDGLFDGQKVLVSVPDDAVGLVYVKGTGALSHGKKSGIWDGADTLGTRISAGLSLGMEWSSSRSQWVVVNTITADYVSGSYEVKIYADGRYHLIESKTLTYAAQTAQTSIETFPISFTSIPQKTSSNSIVPGQSTINIILESVTTSGYTLRGETNLGAPITGTSEPIGAEFKGKY